MPELYDLIWMRQQWRRFRHLLIGALLGVWIVCTTGLLWLRAGDDPAEWFYARLALLFLLGASSLAAVWLFVLATREIRNLGELAAEARLEAARQAREQKRGRRPD